MNEKDRLRAAEARQERRRLLREMSEEKRLMRREAERERQRVKHDSPRFHR